MSHATELAETLTLDGAAARAWEIVVIGAGPAGAAAAGACAKRGASVLLVDKAAFPRRKACGGCVNAAALKLLEACGCGEVPARARAPVVSEIELVAGARRARLAWPEGVALSRERLDRELVDAARRVGAAFLPGACVLASTLEQDHRAVLLQQGPQRQTIRAQVVVMASGLGGPRIQDGPGAVAQVARGAYLGVQAVLPTPPAWYAPGRIVMACGTGGYVGCVQLEDGRLNIAAALHPARLQADHGPGPSVAALLEEAGLPVPQDWPSLDWQGTPALTQRRCPPAGARIFMIGDAAGYVEPFTGEGIAWALASGLAVAPLASEAARRWDPAWIGRWAQEHGRMIRPRQRLCRLITQGVRRTALARRLVALLARHPGLAAPLIRALNADLLQGRG